MRLIDADAIKDLDWITERGMVGCGEEFVYLSAIDQMPTIDAVPVIRCKDCKWFGVGYMCYNTETLGMQPDVYCSLAERKEK